MRLDKARQEKIAERNLHVYIYLEWTERRGDNDKECTTAEGKTGQI